MSRQEATLATPSPVTAVMIAKNASLVAGVSQDHKLRIWALPDAHLLRTVDLNGREANVTAVSDDGRWLLMGDFAGGVTVWDSSSGEVRLEQRFQHYLTAAAFSHDGRLVGIAPGSEAVKVLDVASNRMLYELERTLGGSDAIAFSRDGALVATADGDAVRVYDARNGKLISQNSDFSLVQLTVEFTSDGKQIVAAGGDKVVVFIDAATGKTVRRMKKTAEAVLYLEVSPDGSQLAAITFKADNTSLPAPVIVWDIPSLQKRAEWVSPAGVLSGGWIRTEDGHFLAATVTPDALHLWRVR